MRIWNWLKRRLGWPRAVVKDQTIDIFAAPPPGTWVPAGCPLEERGLLVSVSRKDAGFFFVLPDAYRELVQIVDDPAYSGRQKLGHIMKVTNSPRNFEAVEFLGTSQAPWSRFTIIGCLVLPAELNMFTLRPGCSKVSSYKLDMLTGQPIPGSLVTNPAKWTPESKTFEQEW